MAIRLKKMTRRTLLIAFFLVGLLLTFGIRLIMGNFQGINLKQLGLKAKSICKGSDLLVPPAKADDASTCSCGSTSSDGGGDGGS